MISYKPLAKTLREKSIGIIEVAEKIGITGTCLRQELNNCSYIGVDLLMKICEALSCDICDVIEWEEGEQTIQERVHKLAMIKVDWVKIKNIMDSKGLSMKSTSIKLGMSGNSICQAMKQNGKIKPAILEQLCNILEIKQEEILL